jgi:hypothetical protein
MPKGGTTRLVFVQDTCIGRCRVHSTVLWQFHADAEVTLKTYRWPDAAGQVQEYQLFDPAVIETVISFAMRAMRAGARGPSSQTASTDRPAYSSVIGGPYFFDHLSSAEERARPVIERLENGDLSVTGGSSAFTQQPWIFRGEPVFTARLATRVLVYRYKGGDAIEDLCYLSSHADLAAQKKRR